MLALRCLDNVSTLKNAIKIKLTVISIAHMSPLWMNRRHGSWVRAYYKRCSNIMTSHRNDNAKSWNPKYSIYSLWVVGFNAYEIFASHISLVMKAISSFYLYADELHGFRFVDVFSVHCLRSTTISFEIFPLIDSIA